MPRPPAPQPSPLALPDLGIHNPADTCSLSRMSWISIRVLSWGGTRPKHQITSTSSFQSTEVAALSWALFWALPKLPLKESLHHLEEDHFHCWYPETCFFDHCAELVANRQICFHALLPLYHNGLVWITAGPAPIHLSISCSTFPSLMMMSDHRVIKWCHICWCKLRFRVMRAVVHLSVFMTCRHHCVDTRVSVFTASLMFYQCNSSARHRLYRRRRKMCLKRNSVISSLPVLTSSSPSSFAYISADGSLSEWW